MRLDSNPKRISSSAYVGHLLHLLFHDNMTLHLSGGGATSFDVRGGVTSETTQLCVGLHVSPRSDSKAIQEAI